MATNLRRLRVFRNPAESLISAAHTLFGDLFVLELANNHLGRVDRGLRIIAEHCRMVRFNNVRAAIKLQFRDVDSFVHRDYRDRTDIRYINKTLTTALKKEQFATLVDAIVQGGCIPMATPFDERSVDLCEELDIPIIKIASSDINDWLLLEKIAVMRKPVIVSTGGSSQKDIDDMVTFFANRSIPLAINHCVSIYPSENSELELNQIDFLRDRYPDNVIGFSTHEHQDWKDSILVAYAKGARTFERHIDIQMDGAPVSPYCSLPHQIDAWFKAWHHARLLCGAPGTQRRIPPEKEIRYLDSLVRGLYAKRPLKAGEPLTEDAFYLAIPLLKGQLSCRELMHGEMLVKDCEPDQPILLDMIDGPHMQSEDLRSIIYNRGIDPQPPADTTSSLASMAKALESNTTVNEEAGVKVRVH
ncbi:MAG TPA: N-acetylneuraminate synthase family protein [Bryobacteraceae bacterium]|nr:N-acetylneuraminate synthase family protein [Bryobacteraceae bacterium]